MYKKIAAEKINEGLSFVPRLILAVFAIVFGAVMALTAPPSDKAPLFYGFSAFCAAIAVACITRGRTRQFAGSLIGFVLFLGSGGYLAHEVLVGASFPPPAQNLLS